MEQRVKEIYEKRLKEDDEREQIEELLGPVREEDIPHFDSPMKKLVYALGLKMARKEAAQLMQQKK